VVAVLDSNSDPFGVDHPIPGNDDAARAIALYCDLVARAALDGMAANLGTQIDIGELENPLEEVALDETPAEAPAEAPAESLEEQPASA